jgi:two-component system sporulation sensor kinase B
MDNDLKDFIINILLIFSPLVFYPYLHKLKKSLRTYHFLLYFIFSLALITAMSFPVNINGVIYDFRSVPLALGFLYGGTLVGSALFLTAVTFRYFMDYPNTLLYAFSLFSSLVVVAVICYKFRSVTTVYKKVAVSVVLCTFIKLITFIIYLSATQQLALLFNKPVDTLKTYLLQGLIVAICVYLIEFLNRYYNMKEEIIKNEKASIASHIAASVAHEIRNPLTTVRGFIQLFGKENLEYEKRNYYHKLCLEELDRAQQIITDYLMLAKPEPETIERININKEIHYISNILNSYANLSNTQIKNLLFEENPPMITGDRSKLRQALINICKNAIEGMPNGGFLEIKVDKLNENVIILISDTGIGMTNEQIQRLGTPYYSLKEKGTGLGTMVSFNIIKGMKGKVEVKSVLGQGTVVNLIFPSVDNGKLDSLMM